MPMKLETFNKIKSCLQKEKETKSAWMDWSGRAVLLNHVEEVVTRAFDQQADDEELIKLILTWCKQADEIQRPLNRLARITETLYYITDLMLCDVAPKKRDAAIGTEQKQLSDSVGVFNSNRADDLAKNAVHQSLYRLACLGDPKQLVEVAQGERMKKHYPGSVKQTVAGFLGGVSEYVAGYEYPEAEIEADETDTEYDDCEDHRLRLSLPWVLYRGPENHQFREHYEKKYGLEEKPVATLKLSSSTKNVEALLRREPVVCATVVVSTKNPIEIANNQYRLKKEKRNMLFQRYFEILWNKKHEQDGGADEKSYQNEKRKQIAQWESDYKRDRNLIKNMLAAIAEVESVFQVVSLRRTASR